MRYYNGPQSPLMDLIHDRLSEHTDLGDIEDWPILSLYLARVVKGLRRSDLPEVCSCWRCQAKENEYDEPVEYELVWPV